MEKRFANLASLFLFQIKKYSFLTKCENRFFRVYNVTTF